MQLVAVLDDRRAAGRDRAVAAPVHHHGRGAHACELVAHVEPVDQLEEGRRRLRRRRFALEAREPLLLVAGGGGLYSSVFPSWSAGAHANPIIHQRVETDQSCAIPIPIGSR